MRSCAERYRNRRLRRARTRCSAGASASASRATVRASRSTRFSLPPRSRSNRASSCSISAAAAARRACALRSRVPECRVVGLELQPDLARLAGDNVETNGHGRAGCGACRRPAAAAARACSRQFRSCHGEPAISGTRAGQPAAEPGEGRRRDRGRGRSRRLGPVRGENGAAKGEHHIRAPRRPPRHTARAIWRARSAGLSSSRCGPSTGRDAGRVLVRARSK